MWKSTGFGVKHKVMVPLLNIIIMRWMFCNGKQNLFKASILLQQKLVKLKLFKDPSYLNENVQISLTLP